MIKPEEVITLDFETYFDSDYTLRKLSTSEYIRDDRFKAQCVGIKMGTADVVWIPDVNVEEALRSIDWPSYALLAHHTQFDGFILSDRYGVHPAYYLDTLSMGRGLHSIGVGASLDALAQYYGLGHKLPDILSKTKGVRDLPPEVMAELGLYCAVDTQLCCDLFYQMIGHYEPDELDLIHETCSMFCEPVLRVDIPRATTALQQEKDTKAQKILLADRDPANLSSNPKFAAVLQDLGIDPPMKTSPTTGKPTFAFAKSDEGLQALMAHEDEAVRAVVDARLAVKSTLNETRAQRLIDEGANDRTLPVYLKYYGAHTGRWSGGNKCLTGDTLIIVLRSEKICEIRLEELQSTDLVWDSESFVTHSGLINQGFQEVVEYGGITGTPDHKVFVVGREKPVELTFAKSKKLMLQDGSLPQGLEHIKTPLPNSKR